MRIRKSVSAQSADYITPIWCIPLGVSSTHNAWFCCIRDEPNLHAESVQMVSCGLASLSEGMSPSLQLVQLCEFLELKRSLHNSLLIVFVRSMTYLTYISVHVQEMWLNCETRYICRLIVLVLRCNFTTLMRYMQLDALAVQKFLKVTKHNVVKSLKYFGIIPNKSC